MLYNPKPRFTDEEEARIEEAVEEARRRRHEIEIEEEIRNRIAEDAEKEHEGWL